MWVVERKSVGEMKGMNIARSKTNLNRVDIRNMERI